MKSTLTPNEVIARRVAQEFTEGMLVNLGIGLPTQVANYLPKNMTVFLQSENGLIGLGARPPEGMEDDDLTDAGGTPVMAIPGAARIDSVFSFGLIRGGHLDITVLGGLQVDAQGRLAPRRAGSTGRKAVRHIPEPHPDRLLTQMPDLPLQRPIYRAAPCGSSHRGQPLRNRGSAVGARNICEPASGITPAPERR